VRRDDSDNMRGRESNSTYIVDDLQTIYTVVRLDEPTQSPVVPWLGCRSAGSSSSARAVGRPALAVEIVHGCP
jgi:hypothetical protein